MAEKTMTFEKVAYVPGIRGTSSLEHARAAAKISVSDMEGGARILVRRNQTVVACLKVPGKTAADRDAIRAAVRADLVAGKLDKELSSWYQLKKAADAAREKVPA